MNTNDYIYSEDDNMNLYSNERLRKDKSQSQAQTQFDLCILSNKPPQDFNISSINTSDNKNAIDKGTQYTNNDEYGEEAHRYKLNLDDMEKLNALYLKQQQATNRTKRILDSVKREHSTKSIFEDKSYNNNPTAPQTQRTLKKSKSKLQLIPFFDDKNKLNLPYTHRGSKSIRNNNDDEDDDFYAGAMHKNTFGNNRDNDLYSKIPHHHFDNKTCTKLKKTIFSNNNSTKNIFTTLPYKKKTKSNLRSNDNGFVMPANPFGTVLEAREFFFFND